MYSLEVLGKQSSNKQLKIVHVDCFQGFLRYYDNEEFVWIHFITSNLQ